MWLVLTWMRIRIKPYKRKRKKKEKKCFYLVGTKPNGRGRLFIKVRVYLYISTHTCKKNKTNKKIIIFLSSKDVAKSKISLGSYKR